MAAAVGAAAPLAAISPADVDVARRVVARWRAFVAEREERRCPLLDLCQALPDLFKKEVLERLDPTSRTMLAQVGRPWLAAVLASGLSRLPKGVIMRLQLEEFCTSAERLAWAKANGCHWGVPGLDGWNNPCARAAAGGHLEALQWAREHGCPLSEWSCQYAASGGHLAVLQWARLYHCPWGSACYYAALGGHLDVLQWARAHGCPWSKWDCYCASLRYPGTYAWVLQQPA